MNKTRVTIITKPVIKSSLIFRLPTYGFLLDILAYHKTMAENTGDYCPPSEVSDKDAADRAP